MSLTEEYNIAHSRVELKFSCQDLPDLDYLSKTDAQIFLEVYNPKIKSWVAHPWRSDIVDNSLNPKFVKGFEIDFFFEELQKLKFIVVDVDKPKQPEWRAQEFVGTFECDLGSIVGSPGGKILGSLKDPNHPNKDRGKIIVTAEELIENKTEARHGF
ncbi:2360_t:CDS:2 [Paraglomus brasilianum]|uniref:2360_t:CDS:1 n=1 Tax=Paraglomus brasilianum TaxID=144538 RepID=A0A9N9GBY9_9GLOM|nr:2360_t:CDS:2 [Paraglomus brasilianum]